MSDEVDDPVLTQASFEEIFDELSGRCIGLVIIREFPDKLGSDKSVFDYDYAGGTTRALGLVVKAEAQIIAEGEPHEDET